MKNDLFTVVIPTRNEGDLLHMTVDSINSETHYSNYEIILVDDGSTDGSCDRYHRKTSTNQAGAVRVIDGGGVGIPKARNLGAKHGKGRFVVFLDSHCRVSSNWLDILAHALRPKDVAVAGPTFTHLDRSDPKGCGMTWLNHKLEKTWFLPRDTRRPYEAPLTPGGCQAFRMDTFNAIGGFDEGFTPFGFQDVEICLRAWLLGYRVVVNPSAVIAHFFRTEQRADIDDVGIVYNFVRLIHLHFSPERIRRSLRAIGPYPNLESAVDELYESDVFRIRADFERRRVHDDNWFFRQFVPEEHGVELEFAVHE